MTLIEFYFNVADKHSKIAQLAQRCMDRGEKLTILCPDQPSSQELKHYLQSQMPLSLSSTWSTPADLPLHLHWQLSEISHDDVLINLQHPAPKQFSSYLRTIEIVGELEADKRDARERYKFYRERGYEISHIDTASNQSP